MLPHGDELLSPEDPDVRELRRIAAACGRKHRGETIVVITPHSFRIPDHVSVVYSDYLRDERGTYRTDRELADEVYERARSSGVPAVKINFGTDSGELSSLPLDFGSSIPLSFYRASRLLVIGPARGISREQLYAFGRAIGKASERFDLHLLLSADQSHTHSALGPYGFSFTAKLYDRIIMEIVESNRLRRLLDLDEEIVSSAKPDNYWGALIFAGAVEGRGFRPVDTAYAVKGYFSMLAVLYDR